MSRCLAVLLGLFAFSAAFADAEVYLQVRLDRTAPGVDLRPLAGMDLEVMRSDPDGLTLVVKPRVLERLRQEGYDVTVEIEDLEAFYGERMAGAGGGFGVFHTYSEAVAEMNALHAEFPDLTTAPISIGQTWQGNDIWAMKVSDNPDEEEGEPEVLFDGVHHAREIMTLEVVVHFARYLCENYGQDPLVTFLVEQRQTWFVPIVNPDGILYNELTNPNGGGMWRKNRREQGACDGVDLNRNYLIAWGGSGSSGDPCEDTYRGPEAASEPETQAMMSFMADHEFVTHNSYHSVASLVLYPWGYTSAPAPDEEILDAIAVEMAAASGYATGQPPEVLYVASGTMLDWSYGDEDLKNKVFAFTTEIGGSGFWPDPLERDGLIAENLPANLYLTLVAGSSARITGLAVDAAGNGRLDAGETAQIVATVENNGVIAPATGLEIFLESDDAYLQLDDASAALGDFGPGESGDNAADPFVLTVNGATPEGHVAGVSVRITGDGGLDLVEDFALTVGEASILYAADLEPDEGGWSQDPSHTASTGAFVRIDPNATEFQPGDDTTPSPGVMAWITAQNTDLGTDDVDEGVAATRSPVIDLSGAAEAVLSFNYFFGQRDTNDDPGGDFFRIDLSNDGGASYPVNLVSVDDQYHGAVWKPFEVTLGSVIPITSQMRIRIQAADGPAQGDIVEAGIDDVLILEDDGNDPPPAPALVGPADGEENLPSQPVLEVANAVDPEGDTVVYGFRVYRDQLLTDVAAAVDGVAEGAGTTSWTVTPALDPGTYWWRAYAADPFERGPFMASARFTVGPTSSVEDAGLAGAFRLSRPAPNPVHAGTRIPFYAPLPARMEAAVIDASGRVVAVLRDGPVSAGWGYLSWDGNNTEGRRVASGLYWARVRLGGAQRATRLLVVD